jgi:hypothetical protein
MAPPLATATARRYVPRRGQVLKNVLATLLPSLPRDRCLFRRRRARVVPSNEVVSLLQVGIVNFQALSVIPSRFSPGRK